MNGRHDTRRRVQTPDEIVWCLFACIDSCRSISWSSVHCRLPCLPGLFCKWSLDLSPMECATRWNISEVEEEEDETLCTWAMARKAGMDEDHWYFYCLFTWIRAYQRKEGKGLRACLPRAHSRSSPPRSRSNNNDFVNEDRALNGKPCLHFPYRVGSYGACW